MFPNPVAIHFKSNVNCLYKCTIWNWICCNKIMFTPKNLRSLVSLSAVRIIQITLKVKSCVLNTVSDLHFWRYMYKNNNWIQITLKVKSCVLNRVSDFHFWRYMYKNNNWIRSAWLSERNRIFLKSILIVLVD